ncbi:MFS transporter [Bacillus licheniformis]|nr:MFS transporter [Bacillus licheniformis]
MCRDQLYGSKQYLCCSFCNRGRFKLVCRSIGLDFSAFGWAYCALQIPGGGLVDRFGPRLVYGFTLVTWSLATLLQGFVRGFGSLFGLRLATGAFEAPAFRPITGW